MSEELSILGKVTREAIGPDQLETVAIPSATHTVTVRGDELTARCPVTDQPDFYKVTIVAEARGEAIESKALKLYLQGFRDRGIFAESLAAEISHDLSVALGGLGVEVTLVQQVRGGLSIEATAYTGDIHNG